MGIKLSTLSSTLTKAFPPLPTAAICSNYSSTSGVTFDNIAGATHTLVNTGQRVGTGMIRITGSGIEGATSAGDTVGTSGSLSAQITLPETDPTKLGVVVVSVFIGTTGRNTSLQNIQIQIARTGVSGSTATVNFAPAATVLRQGWLSMAIDVQSMKPELYNAGIGPITLKVIVNQRTPYAADLYVDVALQNSRGRGTIINTADDMYASHRDVLAPILFARGIPLTMYLCTGQFGTGTGINRRLSSAECVAFKQQADNMLEYGINTRNDVASSSFATAQDWVNDLLQAQTDLTSLGLQSQGMYHMALSNGQFTEPYLQAADAAGMKTYRSTQPPTLEAGNYTKYGVTQNCWLSRGNGMDTNSVPTFAASVIIALMDKAMLCGETFGIHYHQVGASYAEAGAIGWLTADVIAIADRQKYWIDQGCQALTVSNWYNRDVNGQFPSS